MRTGTYIEKRRKWADAVTEITVMVDGIESRMSIYDFIQALKKEIDHNLIEEKLRSEIGTVALTFTEDGFKKKLNSAMQSTRGTIDELIEQSIWRIVEHI
jgi:hypothetical protein